MIRPVTRPFSEDLEIQPGHLALSFYSQMRDVWGIPNPEAWET